MIISKLVKVFLNMPKLDQLKVRKVDTRTLYNIYIITCSCKWSIR